MSFLPYISDDILFEKTKYVLELAEEASKDDNKFYKNAIDPFSALFDASRKDITLSEWIESEKVRQGQKTLQNKLGEFHQGILGSIPGWEDLGTGHLIDIKNDSKKIIGEVKNKHNTTKGSDRKTIYENLEHVLNHDHSGYMAYFIEVIPKNRKIYDIEFTPSDNKTKTRKPNNPNIHVIDGKTFYALATGYPDALKMLYEVLPAIIGKILSRNVEDISKDGLFKTLFDRTFI